LWNDRKRYPLLMLRNLVSKEDILMDFIFTGEMKADLQEVDNIFRKSLLPWWDEISVYMPGANEDPGFKLLPAMVINAYKYLGIDKNLAIQMANLFKIIHFASKIHVLIKDDEEGQKHNQELQFTILIGDYIFGKVLRLLLETHADRLLDMFATMICDLNEGLIVEYKLNAGLSEVLARTRGPLYHKAFLSAAHMAGWAEDSVEIYGDLGYNLCMALELIYIYAQNATGKEYLDKAQKISEQMNIKEKSALDSLMGEMAGK